MWHLPNKQTCIKETYTTVLNVHNIEVEETTKWGISKKKEAGFAKATAVYDAALNCLTSTYKQDKNNYYFLKL